LSGVAIVICGDCEGVSSVALLWCEDKSRENCVDAEQFAGHGDGVSGYGSDVSALDVHVGGAILEREGRSIVRREGNLEVKVSVGNVFVRDFKGREEFLTIDEGKGDLVIGVVVYADDGGVVQSDNVEVNVEGCRCSDGGCLWERQRQALVVQSISWASKRE
jgi:hypothetical protein